MVLASDRAIGALFNPKVAREGASLAKESAISLPLGYAGSPKDVQFNIVLYLSVLQKLNST